MLVVVPVSSHDEPLIEDFCDIVRFFSLYKSHSLLVVHRPFDVKFGQTVFERLNRKFGESTIFEFPENGPIGWPSGPNHYWSETIKYLESKKNKMPWFWMEMDTTPIENNWLNSLSKEYELCGKLCLGSLIQLPGSSCPHLDGVAVYPPDLRKICNSWKSISPEIAFDVWCREEIHKQSIQSKIIQQNFRSTNYMCTNSGLIGDSKKKQNSVVRKECMVVHGCVDGSLARLILNKERPDGVVYTDE